MTDSSGGCGSGGDSGTQPPFPTTAQSWWRRRCRRRSILSSGGALARRRCRLQRRLLLRRFRRGEMAEAVQTTGIDAGGAAGAPVGIFVSALQWRPSTPGSGTSSRRHRRPRRWRRQRQRRRRRMAAEGGGVMEGATATCGYRRTRPHVAFRRCAPTRRPPRTRRKPCILRRSTPRLPALRSHVRARAVVFVLIFVLVGRCDGRRWRRRVVDGLGGWSPTVEALNSRLKQSARNATSSSRSASTVPAATSSSSSSNNNNPVR